MSKTLFDEVIGIPPPSTVDVAAIVRRRRRVNALRRVGIAATTVLAVSAMVAGGLNFATRPRTADPATQPPTVVVPFGTLSPDVTPQEVADALLQAVAAVAPDAQWALDGQPQVVASPNAEEGVGAMFGGAGSLTREAITRRIAITIGPSGNAFVCATDQYQETCALGLSAGGATMVVRRLWDAGHPQWTAVWRVDLALADGLVLTIYAYASKMVEHGSLGPVLSQAELVGVAEDVAERLT
jgi:hypothetical protein